MAPRPSISVLTLPPTFLLPSLQTAQTAIRTIRSIAKHPKPNSWNTQRNLPLLQTSKEAARLRRAPTTPLRTGALAVKKGMTAMYDPVTARRAPCTVLQLDRVQVVSHKTLSKHGYWAVQVGAGSKEARNVTRPEQGHFSVNNIPLKRYLMEFRVKDEAGLTAVGTNISADWFQEGQFVDVRADCRGMGFAGGMKRHGWAGQPRSHGNSLSHRVMGSAGGSQGSGSRVIPGKNMPGRMGGQQVTVQNLKIMKVDKENGIVVVHGCVPGPKQAIVQLQDAVKKPWPDVPAAILEDAASAGSTATATV
ncbi:mitochondrial 54S ribosomal protein YmL9 [Myriangium duriaei CBS 260.36]|uniref:Large ribosomal subunit protein uL3m n=1 Tax=Myriangium duriaei CBS 260.36 TaxID=1168546 RepID=A0A9P4J048_9PEZI|nr:mitochondrial 54S ribosomal protein YmL9 [Myriangium duriaei CBS 260.36]